MLASSARYSGARFGMGSGPRAGEAGCVPQLYLGKLGLPEDGGPLLGDIGPGAVIGASDAAHVALLEDDAVAVALGCAYLRAGRHANVRRLAEEIAARSNTRIQFLVGEPYAQETHPDSSYHASTSFLAAADSGIAAALARHGELFEFRKGVLRSKEEAAAGTARSPSKAMPWPSTGAALSTQTAEGAQRTRSMPRRGGGNPKSKVSHVRRTTAPPKVMIAAPADNEAALGKLMFAHVAFNTPEQTQVEQPLSIQAAISTTSGKDLAALVTEGGAVHVLPLRVSGRMTATLAGGVRLRHLAYRSGHAWISEKETTTSEWIVTPRSVGEQFLIPTFDAIVNVDGRKDKRSVRTLEKRIQVDVAWPQTAGQWIEFLRMSGEHLAYVWTTLIAVGAGLWAWIGRGGRVAKVRTVGRRPTPYWSGVFP